jgi:hypothetical protein
VREALNRFRRTASQSKFLYLLTAQGKKFRLQGIVSADVELYLRYLTIKSVLSIRQLMVLQCFYFVVPEIFKTIF